MIGGGGSPARAPIPSCMDPENESLALARAEVLAAWREWRDWRAIRLGRMATRSVSDPVAVATRRAVADADARLEAALARLAEEEP